MTQTQVARLFRSPELGRLATLAAAQGWDVSRLPGGHVAATSPTGARVLMSGTGYVTHGTLRAKVHEFVQAGLDPDWTRKGARARQRQEVRPMQVSAVERPEAAPITPSTATHPTLRRPGAHLTQGGRYAFVGDQEVLDVGGYRVRVGERADGAWIAATRDTSQARNLRQWTGQSRAAVLAKAAEDVVARPPVADGPPSPRRAPRSEALAGVPPEVLAPAPEPEGRLDRVAQGFHVVQAEPGEFPVAAALDALDATVAPAVAALRLAGRDDAADLLTEAAGPTSPAERELLALYRRVLRGE
jgi:hypothetical protein